MAINYPGSPPGSGFDDFTVPSNPEGTPLSEAGTGTRNLTESVGDEGAAITALQQWAALRTHDHSGDGSGVATGKKLNQANTHQNADTDVSATSIHHTLGTGQFQAAAGNHTHDYNTLPNAPWHKCTSLNRPTSPSLCDVIIETDTNRFRMWSQFSPSNVAQVGLYTTDDFTRTNNTDLGSDWNITYYPVDATLNPTGTAGGVLAIPDGSNAQWVFDYSPYGSGGKDLVWPPTGWPWPYVQGRGVAQRVKTLDKHTITDDQQFTWQAGSTAIPFQSPWPPNGSSNDVYLRMSDDGQTYVRATFTYASGVFFKKWLTTTQTSYPAASKAEIVSVYSTTTGPTGEVLIGQLAIPHFDPFSTYQVIITGYTLNFYIDTEFVGKIVDTQQQSMKGASYRGWGFGMTIGRDPTWAATVHSHPTYVNQIWMNDLTYYTGSAIWQLLPMGSIPTLRLTQSTSQTLSHAGSLILWDTVEEDNFNYFNPGASLTNIVIGESGFYDIDMSLQWGTTYYPDTGTIVVLVNGQETTIRQSVNAYTQTVNGTYLGSGAKGSGSKGPHYSVSVPCSGKIRLAEGDVVSVNVYYTTDPSTQDRMTSYSNAGAKIQSHLELHFVGP